MNNFSALRFLVAAVIVMSSILAMGTSAQPAMRDVTLAGLVTCSRCLDLSQHKGFTRWTWAMYKVSQGDDIVLLTSGKHYKLDGDRQQLSKYVEDKVTVSGHLDANVIEVTNITRPPKKSKNAKSFDRIESSYRSQGSEITSQPR